MMSGFALYNSSFEKIMIEVAAIKLIDLSLHRTSDVFPQWLKVRYITEVQV